MNGTTSQQGRRLALAIAAIALALVASGSSGIAAGAANDRAQRITAAFTAWAARSGVRSGAIAVIEDGKITGSIGIGGTRPSDPEPVASESKAITAMCILKLVEAGKLRFTDTLQTLLPDYFATHAPADPAAKKITLAALLTHTSGLGTDPTQGSPLLQFKPFTKPAMAEELAAALAVPLKKHPGYAYNNVNYAALGLVIETVAGEAYDTYCERTVLKPVGITDATMNPDWRVMGAFGGWKLSAEDDARFLQYFDPRSGLNATRAKTWPKVDLGGGASYSLGTLMRPAGGGFNFWHFGSWVWTGSPKASFGAYFARLAGGFGYAANYQPTVDAAAMSDLDASLYKAATRN